MSAETLYDHGNRSWRPGDADVLTKRRQSTGQEVHYFIGPVRETLEEAEADRKRWEEGASRFWRYVTEQLPKPGDRLLFWRRVAGGNTVYRESGWIDCAGWFVSEMNGRAYAPVTSAAESSLREVFAWMPEPDGPPLPPEG